MDHKVLNFVLCAIGAIGMAGCPSGSEPDNGSGGTSTQPTGTGGAGGVIGTGGATAPSGTGGMTVSSGTGGTTVPSGTGGIGGQTASDTVTFVNGVGNGVMTGWGWISSGVPDVVTDPLCNGAVINSTAPCSVKPSWNSPSALCMSGEIPALPETPTQADYDSNWGMEIGISSGGNPPVPIGKSYSTIALSVTGSPATDLRVQLHRNGDPSGTTYCAPYTNAPIPFTAFNTACWDGSGVQMTLADVPLITDVMLYVPSQKKAITVANLCVTGIVFGGSAGNTNPDAGITNACTQIDIDTTAKHRLGDDSNAEGTSLTRTFTVACSYTSAILKMDFNAPTGPNLESPPTISVSNASNSLSKSVASFMPALTDDSCWSTNADISHDYNCAFSASIDVSSVLVPGTNTFTIANGRPDDDYLFSNIRIELTSGASINTGVDGGTDIAGSGVDAGSVDTSVSTPDAGIFDT